MSETEIEAAVDEFRQQYPPILTFAEAATLARVAPATVQDWSSRGLLDECRIGHHRGARLHRDGFARFALTRPRRGGR